jgi:hypothetical protein
MQDELSVKTNVIEERHKKVVLKWSIHENCILQNQKLSGITHSGITLGIKILENVKMWGTIFQEQYNEG